MVPTDENLFSWRSWVNTAQHLKYQSQGLHGQMWSLFLESDPWVLLFPFTGQAGGHEDYFGGHRSGQASGEGGLWCL